MMKDFLYSFSIAGIQIQLRTEQALFISSAFTPFLIESCNPDYEISFRKVSRLPDISGDVIWQEANFKVHPDQNNGFIYSYFDAIKKDLAYAVMRVDADHSKNEVLYLKKGTRAVSELRNCFSHINFEALMLHFQRLCFHAACVETAVGGILFSGPCGIGKSTQAELWCKHRNSRQINGDKPILSKNNQTWMAWGSPYAGSSNVYLNENCPVKAIVMLKQAPQCSIRRLSSLEAFRMVWEGITMHTWDRAYMDRASGLVIDLVTDVPVFEFSCTPDVNAVNYLDQSLKEILI